MESMAADEAWTAPESSSPSNSSSLEDSLLNDEEPDTEDYSSSSELVSEPPSEESFAPNQRQVNEIPQDSSRQTGMNSDVTMTTRSSEYQKHTSSNGSPLSKRVGKWGESGRALSYRIVWGRTRLKTNARSPPPPPPNEPKIQSAPTLAPGFHTF